MTFAELFSERCAELATLRADKKVADTICRDSTPVLFFGDAPNARALSVGINPSWHEFLASNKEPLAPSERRFAHYSDLVGAPARDTDLALRRMATYFNRTPDVCYTKWFDPLEVLHVAFGFGLRSGASAHTDIVSCFATDPAWGGKISRAARAALSASGFETFSRVVVASPNVDTILAIGRTAQVIADRAGLALRTIPTPSDSMPRFSAFVPVLRRGEWRFSADRRLTIIAVKPYWNLPTKPLTPGEVSELPHFVHGRSYQ